MNRDAEYSGWLFQRNALATNIVTQDSLVSNFLGSAEYSQKFGSPDNQTFVRLLYRYILLPEPSQSEVDFQAAQLAASTPRVVLARAFLNSQEFRNGTGPRLTAFLLYSTLLQRESSAEERAALMGQIAAGTPIRNLVSAFVESAEFAAVLN